jgi:hypothetical protein
LRPAAPLLAAPAANHPPKSGYQTGRRTDDYWATRSHCDHSPTEYPWSTPKEGYCRTVTAHPLTERAAVPGRAAAAAPRDCPVQERAKESARWPIGPTRRKDHCSSAKAKAELSVHGCARAAPAAPAPSARRPAPSASSTRRRAYRRLQYP